MGMKTRIFVFGSNLAGIHGAGSARAALEKWGAVWGEGVGHYGNSYAIPTKDQKLQTLPLDVIRYYVDMFVEYARQHPELEFEVVKIGCGLAGFKEEQMAPLFINAGPNCILPQGWRKA
jgi:hypothetical protein